MAESLELLPLRQELAVATRLPSGRAHILGNVEILFDSDETAWITPTQRLVLTEELLTLLAAHLRSHGIKWMRGWGEGGRQGRVITANGPMVTIPQPAFFTDTDNT
jgi:hypothetical protein